MCAWQASGGTPPIPGLAGDGQTPPGITIAGAITAGDPVRGSVFQLTGGVLLLDTPTFSSPLLEIDQTAAITSAFGGPSAIKVVRGFQPSHHSTNPLVFVENDDFGVTADAIQYAGPGAGQGFRTGVAGGIGMHTHAPQAAAHALAQATITAITDANAKTAVQALADTLVELGALTLT